MGKIDDYNFIRPGEDVLREDPEWSVAAKLDKAALKTRWRTPRGHALLEKLKAARLSRDVLEQEVGRFDGHFDLRGIDLAGLDLSSQDLTDIDFFAADLRGCRFHAADLRNTYLSEADIRGCDFSWAKMKGVLIDNVDFDHDTNFAGVDLNRINFTLAELLREQALSQQRIMHMERRHPILARVLKWTSRYGLSLLRFAGVCIAVILLFMLIYALALGMPWVEAMKTSLQAFLGVALPDGPAAAVALVEAAVGYFMLALLAAILARKIMGPIG